MRRITAFSFLIAALGILAGCNFTQRVAGAINPDIVSLADRCAAITRLHWVVANDSRGLGMASIVTKKFWPRIADAQTRRVSEGSLAHASGL